MNYCQTAQQSRITRDLHTFVTNRTRNGDELATSTSLSQFKNSTLPTNWSSGELTAALTRKEEHGCAKRTARCWHNRLNHRLRPIRPLAVGWLVRVPLDYASFHQLRLLVITFMSRRRVILSRVSAFLPFSWQQEKVERIWLARQKQGIIYHGDTWQEKAPMYLNYKYRTLVGQRASRIPLLISLWNRGKLLSIAIEILQEIMLYRFIKRLIRSSGTGIKLTDVVLNFPRRNKLDETRQFLWWEGEVKRKEATLRNEQQQFYQKIFTIINRTYALNFDRESSSNRGRGIR